MDGRFDFNKSSEVPSGAYKWMKNRKIRAMALSFKPTIQSLILHMYTIFEDSSLHSSGENCDTNLAVKDREKDK